MPATLVLTVIGDDRPGLVESLATTVAAHQGNWLESSLAHLAGKFAGIVRVDVPDDRVAALQAALAALDGLRVSADNAGSDGETGGSRRLRLSLVGHDRIGIVREVSQVLARHAVNVEELNTHTASAPMSPPGKNSGEITCPSVATTRRPLPGSGSRAPSWPWRR